MRLIRQLFNRPSEQPLALPAKQPSPQPVEPSVSLTFGWACEECGRIYAGLLNGHCRGRNCHSTKVFHVATLIQEKRAREAQSLKIVAKIKEATRRQERGEFDHISILTAPEPPEAA